MVSMYSIQQSTGIHTLPTHIPYKHKHMYTHLHDTHHLSACRSVPTYVTAHPSCQTTTADHSPCVLVCFVSFSFLLCLAGGKSSLPSSYASAVQSATTIEREVERHITYIYRLLLLLLLLVSCVFALCCRRGGLIRHRL